MCRGTAGRPPSESPIDGVAHPRYRRRTAGNAAASGREGPSRVDESRVVDTRHTASDALKALLDFAPRDAEQHRPAVRAHRGMRRLAQLVKQVPHLLHRERIVRLDGRVARHRRRDARDQRGFGGIRHEELPLKHSTTEQP
jgi:hypothetical protein